MPEPILPRDPADPQGTETLESKAMRDYARRLKKCADAYIAVLDLIPATLVANVSTYRYQLDALTLQTLLDQAGQESADAMLEGGAYNPWLFTQYVEVAMKRGIAQQVANLSAQSPAYKAARGNVLVSEPHRLRMILIRARVFEEMESLSQQVKTDMARLLTDGMGRGQNPIVIAKNLREQLGIEQFRADRIVRTEVSTAQRRAKWDEADDAIEEYGIRTKEMQFSALSATTRATHAERHGKLFTQNEARTWWATGANSINCKCTSITVLVDKEGNPVSQGIIARAQAIKAKMAARDYKWSKE